MGEWYGSIQRLTLPLLRRGTRCVARTLVSRTGARGGGGGGGAAHGGGRARELVAARDAHARIRPGRAGPAHAARELQGSDDAAHPPHPNRLARHLGSDPTAVASARVRCEGLTPRIGPHGSANDAPYDDAVDTGNNAYLALAFCKVRAARALYMPSWRCVVERQVVRCDVIGGEALHVKT